MSEPIPADDPILTVDQVAAMLGCTARGVRERARRHELPGLKFGHDWRFPRSALVAHLNSAALAAAAQRRAPPAPSAISASTDGAASVPRKRGRPRRQPVTLPPAPR